VPQFLLSLLVSVQTPLHTFSVDLQPAEQALLLHTSPVAHALPQVPQFLGRW